MGVSVYHGKHSKFMELIEFVELHHALSTQQTQ